MGSDDREGDKMRRLLKPAGWLLSAGIFFVVMILVVQLLCPLNDIIKNWRSFYCLERQSVETLIVGSSHAFASFNTDMIQERTGKTAYILASNSQNVTQTYFNVLEALKYQTPERIILEAYSINADDNFRGGETDDKNWKKESNIDGMRFGAVKLRAVMEQYRPKNWTYALLSIARFHNNWKSSGDVLESARFLLTGAVDFNDFRPSKSTMSEETMQKYAEAERSMSQYLVVSETNILHFQKLAALCREKGISLYVVMAPMYDVYIDSINYASWADQITALTEQEGVPYLDCNACYDEIGLTAQDFEDAYNSYHHLNASGADKVTAFVMEELYGKKNS